MRTSDPWRLLLKCGLLALPLAVLALFYLALDPFMVLRNRADYYPGPAGVFPNRDWVSSQVLLARSADDRPDSFVFGNSRSMAFETADWIRHLDPDARPYHFDASLESLYGVWSKVRYLDQHGYRLRNVLMVVDADLLRQAVHGDQRALFRKTPAIDGSGKVAFHLAFFEAFLSRGFFLKYGDFVWSGQRRSYMAGAIDKRTLVQDPRTNDLSFRLLEDEIASSGEEYYRSRSEIFDAAIEGAGTPSPPVLGEAQRQRLEDMKAIFERQRTAVRIVVSPLYDRRALAGSDLTTLRTLYGSANVLDRSGPNDITTDRHNYYEASHYRIGVARRLLEEAYARR